MEETTKSISLLYPNGYTDDYKILSDTTMHDLGMDALCDKLSNKEPERRMIARIMSKMTANPSVTKYRCDIFADIMRYPQMRNGMLEILNQVKFLKEFGSFKRDYDETAGAWDLLHRLDEIKDYITSVEAINRCLSDVDLKSEGLILLREYVQEIYTDSGFEELKKDISNLKATTENLKSVTVGINLNERYEAESIGLVSINDKPYTKSNIVGNFCDMIISKNASKQNSMHYQPFTAERSQMLDSAAEVGKLNVMMSNPLMVGLAGVPDGDTTQDLTRYMDKVTNHMISSIIKKLRDTLSKYVTITITDITGLIPEFVYYIRWAEYIESMQQKGLKFSKPCVLCLDENSTDSKSSTTETKDAKASRAKAYDMHETEDAEVNHAKEYDTYAKGIYNMKLVEAAVNDDCEIVTNDIDFDKDKCVYILTGANRGGKTTITQAIGQLFVMAQGGIFIPGESFRFAPVDCIYTHFPADEDKTLDLGRLGEECSRFKEIYKLCTSKSLILLNETFSTTSFEEGYYIARDSVRAILQKGVRTVYNTHMHKLGFEVDVINAESDSNTCAKAASLIVKTDDGNRSFKVEIAPPEGMSYAKDIAKKYGVTYELLTMN